MSVLLTISFHASLLPTAGADSRMPTSAFALGLLVCLCATFGTLWARPLNATGPEFALPVKSSVEAAHESGPTVQDLPTATSARAAQPQHQPVETSRDVAEGDRDSDDQPMEEAARVAAAAGQVDGGLSIPQVGAAHGVAAEEVWGFRHTQIDR
jgi:hypothetical protein